MVAVLVLALFAGWWTEGPSPVEYLEQARVVYPHLQTVPDREVLASAEHVCYALFRGDETVPVPAPEPLNQTKAAEFIELAASLYCEEEL